MLRSSRILACLTAGLAPCLAASMPATAADEVFAPTAQVTIPGVAMGSWDISFVDPTLGQFFLGDRTHNAVDVLNTSSPPSFAHFIGQGVFVGVVPAATCQARGGGGNDCSGPNGVITTNHNELWVTDGDSTVKVFYLNRLLTTPTHVIPTGGIFRADEVCYDPEQQFVMAANNSQGEPGGPGRSPGPFATIISVKTHAVVKTIFFDGTKGSPKATNGAEQ